MDVTNKHRTQLGGAVSISFDFLSSFYAFGFSGELPLGFSSGILLGGLLILNTT